MLLHANATLRIRAALAGTGIELVASCDIADYDARAPEGLRSASWVPRARGLVVAASAGPWLWRAFRARVAKDPALARLEHPYDAFVSEQLGRADAALAAAGVRFQRFEAAFLAPIPVDFVALAQLVCARDSPRARRVVGASWRVDRRRRGRTGDRPRTALLELPRPVRRRVGDSRRHRPGDGGGARPVRAHATTTTSSPTTTGAPPR